ncbi:hypothetical protein BSL82_11155 [Tardibacter chloracetimidivorans]|uniref:Short-chain dehydrogenase n=1 Tax=Tardibacter chloracetimidivorans TaxID=1921510 RepID=A0A1L3ZW00_9SPHN|nr:SDR family oxidoreductase [Tardibacter chloracetimidivorans]API59802.1 hypothetical protein BSL82_11155 [Tardibacter chloracetimidivorans]
MNGQLAGKVAIITGAGSGIGKAMAELFAREGAAVTVADVSGAEEKVAADIGGLAQACRVDVSDAEQIDAMFASTLARHGRVDILCNNAGIGHGFAPLHEIPASAVEAVLDVNLKAAFRVMQRAIAHMLDSGGGAIVNTASTASYRATRGNGAYTASKGGVLAMTRAAAIEYADRNIRVNALCPGVIETPLLANATDAARREVIQTIPMGRTGMPEEMASVALFLASPAASYVTGVGLLADGGRNAGR